MNSNNNADLSATAVNDFGTAAAPSSADDASSSSVYNGISASGEARQHNGNVINSKATSGPVMTLLLIQFHQTMRIRTHPRSVILIRRSERINVTMSFSKLQPKANYRESSSFFVWVQTSITRTIPAIQHCIMLP